LSAEEKAMPKRTPANNKTKPTAADVTSYLNGIEHAGRQKDAFVLLETMSRVTGQSELSTTFNR